MSEDNKVKQRPHKRRTFREPDSKSVIEWLDNQQDLGISIHLIVSDAIRKYGNGDVVTTFIERRDETLDESEVNVPVTKSKSKKEVVTEPKEKILPKRESEPEIKEPTPNDEQDPLTMMIQEQENKERSNE